MGYQGVKDFPELKVKISHKKPKGGGELSEVQKEYNKKNLRNITVLAERFLGQVRAWGVKLYGLYYLQGR